MGLFLGGLLPGLNVTVDDCHVYLHVMGGTGQPLGDVVVYGSVARARYGSVVEEVQGLGHELGTGEGQ